jgi:hypothetical protein
MQNEECGMQNEQKNAATDLSFATTEELMAELIRRSEFIAIGYVALNEPLGIHYRFAGRYLPVMGMLDFMRSELRKKYKNAHKK